MSDNRINLFPRHCTRIACYISKYGYLGNILAIFHMCFVNSINKGNLEILPAKLVCFLTETVSTSSLANKTFERTVKKSKQ